MKTKPQPILTTEQIQARKLAEAFFSDLLAKPQPKAKEKKALPNKTAGVVDPTKSEFYIAEVRQYYIITQECKTCGNSTQYASTKTIRFRATRRRDNLYVELPCLLPPAIDLPAEVIHNFETTDFCPHCVETALRLDTILPATSEQTQQLSLFN